MLEKHLRPNASLGYQVNHLARLMERDLRNRIAEVGVAPGQFAQLLTLYQSDGISQTELCELVQIEQATMANTLDRMERDGLIRRTPDPQDKRRSLIYLTARALEIEGDLVGAAQAVNDLATQGLTPREADSLVAMMGVVIRNLESRKRRRSVGTADSRNQL